MNATTLLTTQRREGLQLSDLIVFVERCQQAGVSADTDLGGSISFGGKLQKVETREPRGGAS